MKTLFCLQENKVFGGKQHLHHRGFLQKSQGQKNRAAEVYEEDEKEVKLLLSFLVFFVLLFDGQSWRNPTAKIALRYDKLMVEKDVYAFNEVFFRLDDIIKNVKRWRVWWSWWDEGEWTRRVEPAQSHQQPLEEVLRSQGDLNILLLARSGAHYHYH